MTEDLETVGGDICPECSDSLPVPKCGTLIVRKNGMDGGLFLACTRYPACDYTEDLELEEKQEPDTTGIWGRRYEGQE